MKSVRNQQHHHHHHERQALDWRKDKNRTMRVDLQICSLRRKKNRFLSFSGSPHKKKRIKNIFNLPIQKRVVLIIRLV